MSGTGAAANPLPPTISTVPPPSNPKKQTRRAIASSTVRNAKRTKKPLGKEQPRPIRKRKCAKIQKRDPATQLVPYFALPYLSAGDLRKQCKVIGMEVAQGTKEDALLDEIQKWYSNPIGYASTHGQ